MFCQLHNHLANYVQYNMQVPGQVERWISFANFGKFNLKDLPLSVFSKAADELGVAFTDHSQKTYVVNVSTWLNVAGKVLM